MELYFPENMAEREHHVPSWDGSARTWRRYTREASWFVRATPVHKRRYCATKLVSRLTGPARLLAMSWQRTDFDSIGGTRAFLQQLAKSPLVRQSLPNAAAICQQYFSFRRHQGEPMHSFLVREALGYSEFLEALVRLHEEKKGIRQHEKDFDLPPEEEEWPDDQQDWSWAWWQDEEWWNEADETQAQPTAAASDPPAHQVTDDASGGSPLHQAPSSITAPPTVGRRSAGVNVPSQAGVPPGFEDEISELTLADTFVLGVLRGFRLVQAAGLTAEEKRDIVASTHGSLEFDVVVRALQTLYDEQFLGRSFGSSQHHASHFHELQVMDTGAQADDDWWSPAYAAESSWDEWQEGQYNGLEEHAPEPDYGMHVESQPGDEAEDEQIREAQAAEKMAENLAMEAQRTWAEAQKATAALRKDRGFGQFKGNSKGEGCWRCGGNHMARDCVDRSAPFKGKSKGEFGYAVESTYGDNYFVGKGKGKSKGRVNRYVHWADMEMQAAWKGSKGKSKSGRPSVNAYSADMYMNGLEIVHEAQTSTMSSSRQVADGEALIDCGATASAGPEESVKGLIRSILAVDRGASVVIEKYMRPCFRFGNGKWGKALYRVVLTSRCSGMPRSFAVFALPNPPDLHHPQFDRGSLVPLLLGMDHLGGLHSAMLIDFYTGMAMDSHGDSMEAYQLPKTKKGHYVCDVVHYLTLGQQCQQGHPQVHVLHEARPGAETVNALEFHPLEYYDMTVADVLLDDVQKQQSHMKLKMLKQLTLKQRSCRDACASTAVSSSMRSQLATDSPNSKTSDLGRNGAAQATFSEEHRDSVHRGSDQGSNTCKEGSAAFRSREGDSGRSSRSSLQRESMAVLRTAPTKSSDEQSSWPVDRLLSVRSQNPVHSSSGQSWEHGTQREPSIGGKDAHSTATVDEGPSAKQADLCSHVQEDRGRGDTSGSHRASGVLPTSGLPQEQVYVKGSFDGGNNGSGFNTGSIDGKLGLGTAAGGGLEHGLSKGDGRKLKGKKEKVQPLTHGLAAKVMLLAATLSSTMASAARTFTNDGHDCLWEVACSPHSWLHQAVEKQGLSARRINLDNGYDIYKSETWLRLSQERRLRRPRRIWFSLPCTRWCPWTRLNYQTPEQKATLESYRRKERKMLRHAADFIKETLAEDPETLIYWEWPVVCEGWKQEPMQDLEHYMDESFIPWRPCRVDGCVYGMQTQNGDFVRKRWKFMTTDEAFWQTFRTKVCTSQHAHGELSGQETSRSAYYPWKLCEAIARFWSRQALGTQQLRYLFAKKDVVVNDQLDCELFPAESQGEPAGDLHDPEDPQDEVAVPEEERKKWEAKVAHFHRAAGHPTARNLARLCRDAGQPSWKVKIAENYQCPACIALRPGGTSSGAVPPAATHELFGPWEAVGMDSSEWTVPGLKKKLKFLLMIDLATKLRVVAPLFEPYDLLQQKHENAQLALKVFTNSWLAHFPKPKHLIVDNAKAFTAGPFAEFCNDIALDLTFPVEKDSWSHGVVEHAIKDLKFTASAIQLEALDQDPVTTLVLAASALNSCEYVSGYTSHQWAFGRDYNLTDEDNRTFQQLAPRLTYSNLVAARQKAEDIARNSRAKRILSKLANSKARQPLRQFNPTQLVKVWRKVLPSDQFIGPRGGLRKSGKPGWIGPGRVIFSEVLPHQAPDDHVDMWCGC